MQQSTADLASSPEYPAAQVPQTRRFRTFRVIMALILREIGSRDSRSSLGFLWAFIEPIGTVIILSFAFAIVVRTPRLGDNFPLYYVTGVVPFHMFSRISNRVAGSIRFSRQLLGFPSVTVLDALFARFILNYVIDILVFVSLASLVVYHYDLPVYVNIQSAALSLTMAGAMALGIGAFNSVLFLAWPTYENIWSMFSRPMFLASGILFLIDDLPDPIFHILWWNPVAHVVAEMRHAFYPNYDTHWVNPSYVFLVACTAFLIGLVSLHRFVYDALDR
jgi:capsular polysaccharide transport system permease protein